MQLLVPWGVPLCGVSTPIKIFFILNKKPMGIPLRVSDIPRYSGEKGGDFEVLICGSLSIQRRFWKTKK